MASPNPPTSRPPEQLDGRPTPESAEGEKGAATLRLNSEAAKVPKHTGDADGISRRQALLAEAAAAQAAAAPAADTDMEAAPVRDWLLRCRGVVCS